MSLPYTVVKKFKSNYFGMLKNKKMKVFAKTWLITRTHYSFDA
jgi:hypothetical protein